MAKQYKNDNGFLVIEMSHLEATTCCNFGMRVSRFVSTIICEHCNEEIKTTDNIYYIAVLNHAVCKKCCDEYVSNHRRYDEDSFYEKRAYKVYADLLNMEEK